MIIDQLNPFISFRPGQREGILEVLDASEDNKIIELNAPTGSGKCLGKDTPVIMYDGSIKMAQDVAIGDVLMGPDSKPRKVLAISTGTGELYKITPIRGGNPFVCNDNHMLSLKRTNDGTRKTGEIFDISVKDYLKTSKTYRHTHKLWHANAIDFTVGSDKFELPPYLLGIWLGDGDVTHFSICNPDNEIASYIENYVKANGLHLRKRDENHCMTYHINNHWEKYVYRDYLKMLMSIHGEKFIPRNYLICSLEHRAELLAGLLDTDGYYTRCGYEIIIKNDRLANDVEFLARSLGISVNRCKKIGTIKKLGFRDIYNRLYLSGTELRRVPCKVFRKITDERKQKKDALVSGFDITPIGVGEFFGFEIDGDHRFLLGDFTVTHNSLMLSIIARAALDNKKYKRALYTTPQVPLVEQLRDDKYLKITALVGKANYPCVALPALNAGECPIPPQRRTGACSRCAYKVAKESFKVARLGATTLDKMLFDPSIGSADILIIDECQGLEEKLVKQSETELPPHINANNLAESLDEWIRIMEMEKMKLETSQSELVGRLLDKPANTTVRTAAKLGRELRRLERTMRKAEKIQSIVESGRIEYVIGNKNTFKLLRGDALFRDLIIDKRLVILASGTPCTKILTDEYKEIRVPHPIPVDRRIVRYVPIGKMSSAYREKTIDDMGPAIAELHRRFNRNTLVHCHSYKVAETLGNAISDEGVRVAWMEPRKRAESIQIWKNSDNTVLVSVDCEEGIDLKGDKFPLNIVACIPFTFRGDAWAMAREEADKKLPKEKQLGNVLTAIAIQQACGRCTRDPMDFSETYILDSNFGWFFRRYNSLFQGWFKDALMVKA